MRHHLGRRAAACPLRHEPAWRRRSYRLVFEIDRACAARRLYRRALGADVPHPAAQAGRRIRRHRADGARGILLAAFQRAHFRAAARAAPQARYHEGGAERAVRHRGGIRGHQGRHVPVGQAARQRRHHEALPARARGRRRDQSRPGVVGRQGPLQEPDAAVFRRPDPRRNPQGHRGAGRGLPPRVRRAGAHFQRRALSCHRKFGSNDQPNRGGYAMGTNR